MPAYDRPSGPEDLSSAPLIPLPASTASLAIEWHVAPADGERFDVWTACCLQWLASKGQKSGRDNTVKAYRRDWAAFFDYFSQYQYVVKGVTHIGLKPWHVGRLHARRWAAALQAAGLAKATIIRKVAALSSFYEYAADQYTINDPEDGEVGLWRSANPFHIMSDLPKPAVNPQFPSTDEVWDLIDAIPLTSVTGWRNLALIWGIFITTKRVSEWTELRAGDVNEGPEGRWFWYTYKGGERKRTAVPDVIWKVVLKYLELSGRPWPLPAHEYIFVATSDAVTRITRRAGGSPLDWSRYHVGLKPISPGYVNHLLKTYGQRVGIDRAKLHAHALRHAGARCRKEHGADIWQLKDQLGHKQITTTDRYSSDVLDQPVDALGQQIAQEMAPRQLRFGFPDLLAGRDQAPPPARRRQRAIAPTFG